MDDEQHKLYEICNCDACIGENIREKSLKLYDHLKLIINKHKISSGEAIYQVDSININCANFFEELCDIVGYYKPSDDIEIKDTDDKIEIDEVDEEDVSNLEIDEDILEENAAFNADDYRHEIEEGEKDENT